MPQAILRHFKAVGLAAVLAMGCVSMVSGSAYAVEPAGAPVALTFAAHTFAMGTETVRVLGSVEPHGYDTHYHFEYVAREKFTLGGWAEAASAPEADAGSGEFSEGAFPDLIVGENLPGLRSGVTYEYRIVAANVAGTVAGASQSVTVPTPGPAAQAPCPNEQFRTGPSARLPDCRAYEQVTPAEKGASMDNWSYGSVQSPVTVGEDGDHLMVQAQYSKWGENSDPSVSSFFFSRTPGGWQMTSATPQPQAGGNSYRPTIFDADLTQIGITVGWTDALLHASPDLEFEVGPPGGAYASVAAMPRGANAEWVAASADFGKLILATEDYTLLGHPTGTASGKDLYEYSEGQLRQVNVETDGSEISSCGARMVEGVEGNDVAESGPVSPYAVSADGSRVFFEDNCTQDLYMRRNGTQTVDIGAYRFIAANPQGSELLLERRSGEAHEILLYDIETATAKLLLTTAPEPPEQILVSENLTVFYFSSKESLNPEAPASLSPESEHAGSIPNDLYRYDVADESLHFVAQVGYDPLLGGDYISPDGRYLYWNSTGVAGDSGESLGPQAYRYDSAENVVQCMSCASPFDPNPKAFTTFFPQESRSGQTIDRVPDTTAFSENGDYVFFDTPAALVPQDIDGETLPTGASAPYAGFDYSSSSDIYEWRKNGIDGCSHVQGCLALISSGEGGVENILLGTTRAGRDVFFTTHSQLASQDTDGQGDVYDARIGGGFPPPARPVECEGDACSTPASPPVDVTPSSFTFAGAGDLPPAPEKTVSKSKKSKPKKKSRPKKQSKPKHGKHKRRSSRTAKGRKHGEASMRRSK